MPARLAVKAFIAHGNSILLIKRRANDVHKPNEWDIPGGRLEIDENPFDGLKRETREEAGIDIEIISPLHVQHFTRDDGQVITMIIFLCKPKSFAVRLSEEHQEFKWQPLSDTDGFPAWLATTLKNTHFLKPELFL